MVQAAACDLHCLREMLSERSHLGQAWSTQRVATRNGSFAVERVLFRCEGLELCLESTKSVPSAAGASRCH